MESAPSDIERFANALPGAFAIFELRPDGLMMTSYTDSLPSALGIAPDELAERTHGDILRLVADDDRDDLMGSLGRAARSHTDVRCRYRVIHGNDFQWRSVRTKLLDHKDGCPIFITEFLDTTPQITAQSEIAEANRRFVHMMQNIPAAIVIYVKTDEGIFLETVSEASVHVAGETSDAAHRDENGKLLEEHTHPDDLQIARAGFQELFSERHEAVFIYRNRADDASEYRWLQGRGKSFPQEDGTQVAYVVFSDVTDSVEARKIAEQELANERLRMQSLQGDILAASCFDVTTDTNIELNNDENLGYSPIDDNGIDGIASMAEPRIASQRPETKSVLLSAAESIPDITQREEFVRMCSHAGMLDSYMRGEREMKLEYRRRTGKGLIWVQTRIVLLRDPTTEDILAFLYTSDIDDQMTKRLATERILATTFEYVALVDVPKRQVRPLSIADEKVTPHAFDDHDADIAHSFGITVVPEEREEAVEALRLDHIVEMLDANDTYSFAFTTEGRDGRRGRKQLTYSYLDDEKTLVLVAGTDITLSVQREREQQATLEEALRRAESANAAKSDFLSRMSHDIRTPMNGIIGMTRIAREYENPPETVTCLDKIDTSSKFLLGLVNDILDLSKVESGKMELHLEPYLVSEFLDYLDTIFRPMCEEKSITFRADGNTVVDQVPLMDKLRVNQIFFNLISNSVKFTPEGGSISYHVDEWMTDAGRFSLQATVSDTGIGMSEEFQGRLFEAFSQENRVDQAKGQGSGLGLAIVKNLMDLMGGTISVKSTPGKGTTFTLACQFDSVPASSVVATHDVVPDDGDLTGMHVLVCEDHPLNQEIVSHLLQGRGAIVTLTEDGRQGLEAFSGSLPGFFDAILMDVRMPVMGGLEATQAIRALGRPDAKAIPIIAMTANAYEDDVRDCLDAGMNAHIAKPFEPEQVYGALREYVAKRPDRS